MYLIAIELKF